MAELIPPSNENQPANRGLWYLVIGLGVAILIVVAAMIAMAIRNVMLKKPEGASPAITTVPGDVPELALDLPAGATVAETRMEGTTLLVRVSSAAGDEIFVIDPRAAKVLARIKLNKPAAAAPP
jgi:hypothetical protein